MNLFPENKDRVWQESHKKNGFSFFSLKYILFFLVLLSLLIGLWYLISPSSQLYDKNDLPLIKADRTPYKMKPDTQDIPSVKHQDKLVYGRIRSDQNEPIVEHILPDPEPPLPTAEHKPVKMIEQYLPIDGDPEKGIDHIEENPEKTITSLTSIEDLIDDTLQNQPPSIAGITKNKAFIQLASFKSYDMAELEWKRLIEKHPEKLTKLEPIIQKVDLGEEKGIYYRLRTGSFENINEANEVCVYLKEQKVDCSVVP